MRVLPNSGWTLLKALLTLYIARTKNTHLPTNGMLGNHLVHLVAEIGDSSRHIVVAVNPNIES